jgi:hypothetical protein
MEGSGESCLHLALPVIERARSAGHQFQLVLVDYADEQYLTLDRLIAQVHELVVGEAAGRQCVLWAQSFGNLLAAGVHGLSGISAQRLVLVSAFTALPQTMTGIAAIALRITPNVLYRATIGPIGRCVFGPVGEESSHPFFASLQRAEARTVQRRTQWLSGREFPTLFSSISAPAKVWLGAEDRLVDISTQRTFFEQLAQARENYCVAMVEGSGHVVLPHAAGTAIRRELYEWLIRTD